MWEPIIRFLFKICHPKAQRYFYTVQIFHKRIVFLLYDLELTTRFTKTLIVPTVCA